MNRMHRVQMNGTSDRDGNVETACGMGAYGLNEYECSGIIIQRTMAIAFINSGIHSHIRSDDEWDDYSVCDEEFDTRMAVGIHAATYKDLKEFSSLDARPIYIKDNAYTMEAAEHLTTCFEKKCHCDSANVSPPTFCEITRDHFGLILGDGPGGNNFESFDQHDSCCL